MHLHFVHLVKHNIQVVTVLEETVPVVLIELMPVLACVFVERFCESTLTSESTSPVGR